MRLVTDSSGLGASLCRFAGVDLAPSKAILVLVRKTIHVPGDERSRTSPGHGYPAHTETAWDLYEADSTADVAKWLLDHEGQHCLILSAELMQAKKHVSFTIAPS